MSNTEFWELVARVSNLRMLPKSTERTVEHVMAVKLAKRMLKATSRRSGTWQLAASVAFGLAVGLLPTSSPMFLICIAIGWVAPIHPALFLAVAMGSTFISGPLTPMLHAVGTWSLTESPAVGFWDLALALPLVPWLGLQNSVVNGAVVIGMLSIFPVAFVVSPITRLIAQDSKPIGATHSNASSYSISSSLTSSSNLIGAAHFSQAGLGVEELEAEEKARTRALLEEIAAEVLFDPVTSPERLGNVDTVLLELGDGPQLSMSPDSLSSPISIIAPAATEGTLPTEMRSTGDADDQRIVAKTAQPDREHTQSVPTPHIASESDRRTLSSRNSHSEFRDLEPIQRLERLLQECRDESQQHDAASVLARATVMTDMIDELLNTIEIETRPYLAPTPAPHFNAETTPHRRQDMQEHHPGSAVIGTQSPGSVNEQAAKSLSASDNGGREVCISTHDFETKVEITRNANASQKDVYMSRPSVAIGGQSESMKTMNQIQLAGHQRRTVIGQSAGNKSTAETTTAMPSGDAGQSVDAPQPRSTEEVLRNLLSHIRELKQKS